MRPNSFQFIIGILLLIPMAGFSQSAYQGNRIMLATRDQGAESAFYIYDPPFKAKPVFKDTAEAKNQYPEQLMESMISANNQKWVDYNTLGGSTKSRKHDEKYFERVKNAGKESLFLELKAKYTFQYAGNEIAIIKYYLHAPGISPTSGAYVLQRVGARWYYTSTTFTSDLAVLIMRFREEKLKLILKGEIIGDKRTDDVMASVKDAAGNILTDKLVKEFNNWIENNPDYTEYYKDPNTW